jgi:hypothetical protein
MRLLLLAAATASHWLALTPLIAQPTDASPLGLGVADVALAPGLGLGLYDDPTSEAPAITLTAFFDEDAGVLRLLAAEAGVVDPSGVPEWLRPETLWLDMDILAFRAVDSTAAGLEVVVDEDTGRTMWLRSADLMPSGPAEFMRWEAYLPAKATAIEPIVPSGSIVYPPPPPEEPLLRLEPGGEPATFQNTECIRPAEVRGEWMRIEPGEVCGGEIPSEDEVGGLWIRWRDGERMLVTYFLSC